MHFCWGLRSERVSSCTPEDCPVLLSWHTIGTPKYKGFPSLEEFEPAFQESDVCPAPTLKVEALKRRFGENDW